MTDPADPTTFEKLGTTIIGTIVGSLCAIGVSPAETRRDALTRLVIGAMFSVCLCPLAVRGCVKWCGVSNPAILDTTLAVGCVIGICSWWLIHAIVSVVKKRAQSSLEAALDRALPDHDTDKESTK